MLLLWLVVNALLQILLSTIVPGALGVNVAERQTSFHDGPRLHYTLVDSIRAEYGHAFLGINSK